MASQMMRTEARPASLQRIAGFKTLGKGVEITHPAVEPKRASGAGVARDYPVFKGYPLEFADLQCHCFELRRIVY